MPITVTSRARPIKLDMLCSAGGTKMPLGWKSPMREADGTPKKLYGSAVTLPDGNRLRVGPAMLEDFARPFHEALTIAIKTGKITGWSEPTLVRVT